MRTGWMLGAAMIAASLVSVSTGATIGVGTWDVPVGSSAFEIPLVIEGGDTITDAQLYVQVADGGAGVGGSIDGPDIVNVEVKPFDIGGGVEASIWASAPGGIVTPLTVATQLDQFWEVLIELDQAGESVAADGLLAVITIDASGFTEGESFELRLAGVAGGNDTFLLDDGADVPLTVTNGVINIVPEPASVVMLGASVLVLLRRRRGA